MPASYLTSRYHGPDLADFRPRRILACQLRQIGDVVLTTPSLRLLRQRFPEAVLDVLTEKKCAPVLRNNPDVSRIYEVDRSLGFWGTLAFSWRTGRAGHDMIVDFQQLPRIRWVLLFSRARVKFTYPPPWYNRPLYTHWAEMSGPYAAKCKAGPLLNGLGLEWDDPRPRLYLDDAERAWAGEFLAAHGLAPGEVLVSVDPTHRRATRCWPARHYARLLDLAAEARPGLRFLIHYGPGEKEVAEELVRSMARPESCIVPERVTDLREMAALIARARVHLGNCSSPRHFATALDVPTLTIRGSTSNAWTCPLPEHEDLALGMPCQPCNDDVCPRGDAACLRDLTPESVLPRLLAKLA